ncbi:MAG TPA: methyltransferase domain-containing protein, partial [Patescibacteria group bacterium]|nr:methyltransferase domain-containing protein [Patescibacteria group bacterium]
MERVNEANGNQNLKEQFREANEKRDYSVYTWLMDAALEAKAKSIFPYIDAEEGDVIVDAGSGTGALAELAARAFRGTEVYALDISHELRTRAQEKQALIHLAYGDASEQVFPENSVKVKYYSTSGHEIESFGGAGRMRAAMESTWRELVPGGRVIVRDFAKPSFSGPVYLQILSQVGLPHAPADASPEMIDYNKLSTSALLERFQHEFGGGGRFTYENVLIGGVHYFKMSAEWAHEFYLRKDYTGNWHQEIQEKYTYWSPEEARALLEELGYEHVQVIPDPNDWIIKNRLEGRVALFSKKGKTLIPMPFPPTHMIVVGDKPKEKISESRNRAPLPEVNYRTVLSRIQIHPAEQRLTIDDRTFALADVPPFRGQKKIGYVLSG